MVFESVRPITHEAAATAIRIRRFLVLNTAAQVAEAGADAEAVGVSLEAVAVSSAGTTLAVAALDGSKVEVAAGAAVTIGDFVTSDAQGRAVTATTGERILGQAMEAAGAADEVITILTGKGALGAA